MEKDMSQECTTIPEDFHKHAPNLTTHTAFFIFVFYTDYAKNHPPKSNCRQVDQNSSKAFNIALI